ncbi:predicted protein [Lichtheimia corymbifera JMRC:FSU:9682]|uniref:Uncharacterized protein n=1 Tax=Lichtheimia corymbifera JMRC:FSU:9682 TaxID=1263082 RepID=A0A068RZ27_9FUNG|nr:predicted protein [Lichtheimia corymbifera JMRC:FSU:9682]
MKHGVVTRTTLIGMVESTLCQSFPIHVWKLKFSDCDVGQKVSRGGPGFNLAGGETTKFEIAGMDPQTLTHDTFDYANQLCSSNQPHDSL